MKLDVFGKIALTIIVTSALLLIAFHLWGCETRIGKVEWIDHPNGAILEEENDDGCNVSKI